MANYQNNMRYGRQGNMHPMRPAPGMHTGYQSSAPQADARCCGPAHQRNAVQREDCGRCAPETDMIRRENRGCCAPEANMTRREDRGCCAPEANMTRREDRGCCAPETDMIRREDRGCCAPKTEARETAECREQNMPKGCGRMTEDPLYGMPLAMAYVPWQTWCQISDLCEGFRSGTIFEELNKPFLGRGGWKR